MDVVPYLTTVQIETLLHGIALVAGGVAFGIGVWQYSKGQAWKRYEFVAAEAREFYADRQIRNAMQMIDWGTREIELFPDHPDYNSRFVAITRPVLHTALTTHDKIGRPFTRTEAAIRDCFDAFWGGLERFEEFVQAGLVRPKEVEPYLDYWMRSICKEANPELQRILNEYVVFYHFIGVSTLFNRYGWQFGTGKALPPSDRQKVEEEYDNVYEVT